MPNCINCGMEISEEQNRNFNGLCPNCAQLVKPTKQKVGGYWLKKRKEKRRKKKLEL
ncbi:MAG: hypothetical protein ACFFFB_11660 [Candidatus Heimdallarchaeota archaeon]